MRGISHMINTIGYDVSYPCSKSSTFQRFRGAGHFFFYGIASLGGFSQMQHESFSSIIFVSECGSRLLW